MRRAAAALVQRAASAGARSCAQGTAGGFDVWPQLVLAREGCVLVADRAPPPPAAASPHGCLPCAHSAPHFWPSPPSTLSRGVFMHPAAWSGRQCQPQGSRWGQAGAAWGRRCFCRAAGRGSGAAHRRGAGGARPQQLHHGWRHAGAVGLWLLCGHFAAGKGPEAADQGAPGQLVGHA